MTESSFFWFGILVLAYYLMLSLSYLVLFVQSVFESRRRSRESHLGNFGQLDFAFAPAVSILVPAFNEEKTIIQSVKNFLNLDYPEFEVIVVNDGSQDKTLQLLRERFSLRRNDYPFRKELRHQPIKGIWGAGGSAKLTVVDKEKGGRGDALNAGINIARYPLVCILDADSLLRRDALTEIVVPLVKNSETVVAAGGQVGIGNGLLVRNGVILEIDLPRGPLVVFQLCEYLRAFIAGRIGWSVLNVLPNISGAFGLFQRRHLMAVGGFDSRSVGEDMELTVRLHEYFRLTSKKYKIAFIPDAVSWTEAPASLGDLARQRNRWHRGLLEILWQHKQMILNPKFGVFGLVTLPYYVAFELIGPMIELLGYIILPIGYFLGFIDPRLVLLVLFVAVSFHLFFTMLALMLERFTLHNYPRFADFLRLLLYAFLENFGYRQLTVVWRVKGIFDYLRGERAWGKITRHGFTTDTEE